ncbi:hypothetical protein [Flavihumibacter petaseus]|uniref:Uncharacterized protein n=1 Tax=Flavihumibacter petaseus NBRC 106054 TaxID=1220578 RepID=A0A0E9MYY0_9BACT|nr:hypothetical protein [Flavihumibacter petaseus]GAO42814.1 hypothetical protein FPE01S_01_18320 [Flavihumibacter petaseus NBRC 106054]
MSLLNNNKNAKDKKKGTANQKSGFAANIKGKTNTKAASRQTKLTGGAQRGS